MVTELVMPKLGLTMTEGFIVQWLKSEGEEVRKGDELLEIETEKLTNGIESPADGVLLKIVGEAGTSLPIAATLAYIGAVDDEVPKVAAGSGGASDATLNVAASEGSGGAAQKTATFVESTQDSGDRVKASPAARALARTLGVDYTRLSGTGPGGRIVKKDIEAAASRGAAARAPETVTVIPYAGMRKAIGEGMSGSWTTAPMVTHHVRADVTELLALRESLNKELDAGEYKVGVLELFIKIVSRAIRDFPIVNATLAGNEIRVSNCVNIGVAVAVENGLLVPVVKDAESKSLFAIGRETKDLIARARSAGLSPAEITGGTFTISNLGGYGSVDFFTPIINQPESAILGICRTVQEPVVRNGEIVIRQMTGLSFTFDHRVVDGAPAAAFLAALLKYLEKPARAVFED